MNKKQREEHEKAFAKASEMPVEALNQFRAQLDKTLTGNWLLNRDQLVVHASASNIRKLFRR